MGDETTPVDAPDVGTQEAPPLDAPTSEPSGEGEEGQEEPTSPDEANVKEAFQAVMYGPSAGHAGEWRDTYDEAVADGKVACVDENIESFTVNKVFKNLDHVEPVPSTEEPTEDTTTPTGTGQGGVIPGSPPPAEVPQPTGATVSNAPIDGTFSGSVG